VHLQARRLQYVHALVATLLPGVLAIAPKVMSIAVPDLTSDMMSNAVPDLTSDIAYGYELKSDREEISRLLSMFASFAAAGATDMYWSGVKVVPLPERLTCIGLASKQWRPVRLAPPT
jgi:hypothetical protein